MPWLRTHILCQTGLYSSEWIKRFPTSFLPGAGNPVLPPDSHVSHKPGFASSLGKTDSSCVGQRKCFFLPPHPHHVCGVSFGRTQDWHKLSTAFLSRWSSWAKGVSCRPRHTQAVRFLSVWDMLPASAISFSDFHIDILKCLREGKLIFLPQIQMLSKLKLLGGLSPFTMSSR